MASYLSFLLAFVGLSVSGVELEGAGIQLFTPDRQKTLLVQGKSGRWGWTKGHREPFDTNWLETAIREVREESGFDLGNEYWICSSTPQQWGKRLYWQGITKYDMPEPRHNIYEHLAIAWFPLDNLSNLPLGKDVLEWKRSSNTIHCDFDMNPL